jgi:hypothetical protein
MNLIDLIARFGTGDCTAKEAARLEDELGAAYESDEAAASDPEVERIAQKVRRMLADQSQESPEKDETRR